jgi:excisionase family DNA binding protein
MIDQAETTAAARVRLHRMIDEQIEVLRALLKSQADAMLEHVAAASRATAATRRQDDEAMIYDRKATALILKCSVRTVDKLVKLGRLPYTRRWEGGPRCFTREHLDEYKGYLLAQTKGGEKSRSPHGR